MSSNLANTLYARLLQAREIDRQRKLEQERYDREFQDKAMQRNLDEQRLTERAKELEFTRHIKVAEAEARAASLRGRGASPGQYHNPAVAEAARVAFEGGQVDLEKQNYDRRKEYDDLEQKRFDTESQNYRQQLGSMERTINDWDVAKTPGAYRQYESRVGLPENTLGDRPYLERFAPRDGGGNSDSERLKHFDKAESYLNQAAGGKEEWAAFAKAGQLRMMALDLRQMAASGKHFPEAVREVAELYGMKDADRFALVVQKILTDEEAPALGRVSGPRPSYSASPGTPDGDL